MGRQGEFRQPLVRLFDLPAHRGIVLLKAGQAIGNANSPPVPL
jgi:hypothetical protein